MTTATALVLAAADDSSSSTVVAVLAALGGLSFIGTAIQVFANRRKLSADAVSVIQQAASGIVADVRIDRARLEAKLEQTEQKLDAMHRHLDFVIDLFRQHAPGVAVPPFRWPPLPERQSNGHTG